ncbi:lipocalin-like domain-containing protein [Pseudomonas sp. MLB6B]
MKRECCLLLSLFLAGCDAPESTPRSYAGLGQEAAAYTQVQRGVPLVFPRDHGAHDGFRIEWWYVTANLHDAQGRDWGVQWTLFRSALRPGAVEPGWSSANLWMAHAALTGPGGHQSSERLARGGIGQAGVQTAPLRAWIDDWALTGDAQIRDLNMRAQGEGFAYDLNLASQKPLVLHGDHGYSEKSGQGQASYYYSQPFYQVSGVVERDGQRIPVTGNAWLDREWSSQPLAAGQSGWDWFSLHLDGGAKLMLFQVRQDHGKPYRAGTWIGADGQSEPLQGEQIQLTPQTSTRQREGQVVPTQWRVQVPSKRLDVQVQALEPQAWMHTRFPYWEGPVRIEGSSGGRGYLEMTGYAPSE